MFIPTTQQGHEKITVWIWAMQEMGGKAGFYQQNQIKSGTYQKISWGTHPKSFKFFCARGQCSAETCPEVLRQVAKQCWPAEVLHKHVHLVLLDCSTAAKPQLSPVLPASLVSWAQLTTLPTWAWALQYCASNRKNRKNSRNSQINVSAALQTNVPYT